MASDPWYTTAKDEKLNQGDLLTACPILWPKPATEWIQQSSTATGIASEGLRQGSDTRTQYQMMVRVSNVVVMTQSCDLTNEKTGFVLICPFYSFSDLLERINKENPKHKSNKKHIFGVLRGTVNNIVSGTTVSKYLLGPCILKNWVRGMCIVDFERAVSMPYSYIKVISDSQKVRLRIKSPYREHLSQAFATFFMRVALDYDVKKEEVKAELDALEEDYQIS
jgi:hypothetical protein